jgi:hypothetical protein
LGKLPMEQALDTFMAVQNQVQRTAQPTPPEPPQDDE